MYVDPNVGGILFQALAVIATVITGVFFAFSRQVRSGVARMKRLIGRAQDKARSEPGPRESAENAMKD
jgi:uncharacterized membrane protein